MEIKKLFKFGLMIFFLTVVVTVREMAPQLATENIVAGGYEVTQQGALEESVGVMLIGNAMSPASRGTIREKEQLSQGQLLDSNMEYNDQFETELVIGENQDEEELFGILENQESDQASGSISIGNESILNDENIVSSDESLQEETVTEVITSDGVNTSSTSEFDSGNGKPLVIIYHTHGTESYNPYSEGNYHIEAELGTVREVGSIMAEELQRLGYQVIHDKTLHDNISYNESYSRSYKTITGLLEKYDPVAVIDLHRDASVTGPKTVLVNGETVATYSLVVGEANKNLDSLYAFANLFNTTAEVMYPGFGGRVIPKDYNYNQNVHDNYMLLEVGNNENNIEEAKKTGKYLANVLAETLKKYK